ncbi:hypothetical protein V6N12_053597 [Hibiscus sabdariffa]|uniref:Reverse transcriptase zinc-binding domain n=1 Tax=Hibiscus sabdariffa TaxID=183260 RepID=A0ABR2D9Q9_9ROSI
MYEHSEDYNQHNADKERSFFSNLWSLTLPPKVKITFWKFAKNFLPTFANLSYRRLNVELECTLCRSGTESVEHLMCHCSFTSQLFTEFDLKFSAYTGVQSWLLWLTHLFDQLSREKKIVFVTLVWALWIYRNNKVHENNSQSAKDLALFVLAFVQEYDGIHKVSSPQQNTDNICWNPPIGDSVKVNFDASFNSSEKRSTSSIIIRDSSGLPMAASTVPHLFTMDPEMAEVKACEQAILLARDLGFRKVIIEGDALNVISKLNSLVEDRSDISAIVKNIQDVRKQFQIISFVHVRRRCNRVAHILAKDYGSATTHMVWIEQVPSYAEEAVVDDRRWMIPPNY